MDIDGDLIDIVFIVVILYFILLPEYFIKTRNTSNPVKLFDIYVNKNSIYCQINQLRDRGLYAPYELKMLGDSRVNK